MGTRQPRDEKGRYAAKPAEAPTAVPPSVAAVLGIRSSGAAGPHLDKRTRRARTRGTQRGRAIDESRDT